MAIGTILIELGFLAILRYWGIEEIPSIIPSLLIVVFSVVYIGSLGKKKHARNVGWALAAGYCFRVLLIFFDIYCHDFYALPNSGADSVGFYRHATNYAKGLIKGDISGFPLVMGLYFKNFGISRLYGQFLLMLCSVVSLENAAKSMTLLEIDAKAKEKAMWVLCLLPNFAILSSIFLRESLVAMFITLSLYQYVSWMKKKREGHFVLAIALVFAASYFHSGSIAVAVGYLISRLLYDNKTGKLRLTFRNVLATVILLFVGVFVLNRFGDDLLAKFGKLDSLEAVANESTLGGSSYARYVGNSNNPVNMILFTIPRIVFFLFSPMPWMIRGISDIIAFCFSSCYYIMVLFMTFRCLTNRRMQNREIIFTLFIVVMAAAFVFGWGTANTGTACRHRDKMTAVWAVELALVEKKKREIL